MYSAEDLFTDELDDQNDLEIIHEGQEVDGNAVEEIERDAQSGDENDNEGGDKQTVKPKRTVRNPQPKLNLETLKSSKGLASMPALFAKCKFKGRGHEEEDLRVLMKSYEYFCHRLFPKCQFDDCISKLETLGNKKPVKTLITRIRMGLMVEDDPVVQNDEDIVEEPIQDDPFDNLIGRTPAVQTPELTEEQLQRIQLNRENAERLRRERLIKIQELAETRLESSSYLPIQDSNAIDLGESQQSQTNQELNRSEEHEYSEDNQMDIVNVDNDILSDIAVSQKSTLDSQEVVSIIGESQNDENLKETHIEDEIDVNSRVQSNMEESQISLNSLENKLQQEKEGNSNEMEVLEEVTDGHTNSNDPDILQNKNDVTVADNGVEDDITLKTLENQLEESGPQVENMVDNAIELPNENLNNVKIADSIDISQMLAEDSDMFNEAFNNASVVIENSRTSIQPKSFYGKKTAIKNSSESNSTTTQNADIISSQTSEDALAINDILDQLNEETAMECE